AAQIVLIPEKTVIHADGHDLVCIDVQIRDRQGRIVPDAEMFLRAEVTGAAWLAGFGSANPVTGEDFRDENAVSFRGRAQLIIRSGSETGEICVKVFPEKLEAAALNLTAV
ncbi:MAG: glycoside hydrolase family 2 protein, partial [Lachnospiraceae bacterium]|nr:glycoside hydrolase family 2 protein [Lachnospiraceae bacterium]